MDGGGSWGARVLGAEPMRAIQAGQEAFKKLHWDARMVHLVPKNAQVTSVGIPLLFTSYALYSLGRGYYNMSFGIGKIEGN